MASVYFYIIGIEGLVKQSGQKTLSSKFFLLYVKE